RGADLLRARALAPPVDDRRVDRLRRFPRLRVDLSARRSGGAREKLAGARPLRIAVGDAQAHLLQRLRELAPSSGHARRAVGEERLRVAEVPTVAELAGERDDLLGVRFGHLRDELVELVLERRPGRLARGEVRGDRKEHLDALVLAQARVEWKSQGTLAQRRAASESTAGSPAVKARNQRTRARKARTGIASARRGVQPSRRATGP